MIERWKSVAVLDGLREAPSVCLLGPRQVGKTTLALEVARRLNGLYLDLESEADRAKLADAETFLGRHLDKLVVLDELHRMPALFQPLRVLIDQARRQGYNSGRYLLLGSAALSLLRQSSESLAGRIYFVELAPFNVLEPTGISLDVQWVRGGFPPSLLATDDTASMRWRRNFIRTYVERDIPQFGPRIAAETLSRFWTMLAHRQGAPLNIAELARSLGSDTRTVSRYIDLMTDLFLLRRLPPWHSNTGKRLIKSPRIYLRDSGIVHALLGIQDLDSLLSHPSAGASWEGFAIENLLSSAPEGTEAYYYRTSGGGEIDLLLMLPRGNLVAVEIKRNMVPAPSRGFHEACADLKPKRRVVIYPGNDRFVIKNEVEAMPLADFCREIAGLPSSHDS